MHRGPELTLVEKPTIDYLRSLGYGYLPPEKPDAARDGANQVLLRDEVVGALERLNGVSREVARAAYHDLLNVADNERWFALLRGDYSRKVEDQRTAQTLRLIDFQRPAENRFLVTRQLRVEGEGQKARIPDLVLYVNGVPLVVIECKKPETGDQKLKQAFEQIKQYERDIPRLFYSNAFNVTTDGLRVLYGATGAPSAHWLSWKDPWPRAEASFVDAHQAGLWSLLEPARLLDLIAHFIVFETRTGKDETGEIVKKICRYQQYRAVNKIVERVVTGDHPRGLIWHTQGSGKSLTMVFAALKLKLHKTIDVAQAAPALANPSLLVLTDRKDLDTQITRTFQACRLPNPRPIRSIQELHLRIHNTTVGLTVLSTIQKLEGSRRAVPRSDQWIILVDECHRTQEKDLGAYLRATFPDARFFGFTGTPVKKTDRDTYANFGAPGEGYLDRYSIDDAVADGATVPIHYTSRMAEWQVEADKLDVLFDGWFAGLPEERVAALKARGVTVADLLKHPDRVEINAYDIWKHFTANAQPDGFKAQLVAVDREAIILYKRALDQLIAEHYEKRHGCSPEHSRLYAAETTACVYSSSQEDDKPSEDPWEESIRQGLRDHALDEQAERKIIDAFVNTPGPPEILIVCDKLLTGFDAPVEAVLYLDSPLKEHNLLQAIARTNRVHDLHKHFGLVVDYVGVTRNLKEALQSYREADVQNAMHDLDHLRRALAAAHAEVAAELRACFGPAGRKRSPTIRDGLMDEIRAFVDHLGTEDRWYTFKRNAQAFIRAYGDLSPAPAVLEHRDNLKWVANFLPFGVQQFEKLEVFTGLDACGKIRRMLTEHLHVTGMITLIKAWDLTDPEYWMDFDKDDPPQDLKVAAIRKATELKKILTERLDQNPVPYGPFSERVLEILRKLEAGQIDAAQALDDYHQLSKDLQAEDRAHRQSGLSARAYGLYTILRPYAPNRDDAVLDVEKDVDFFFDVDFGDDEDDDEDELDPDAPEFAIVTALRLVAAQKDAEPQNRGYQPTLGGAHASNGHDRAGRTRDSRGDRGSRAPRPLSPTQRLATQIDDLYGNDRTAPPLWHQKDQLRKELRQQVRRLLNQAGFEKRHLKTLPIKVEEYALKHHRREA